MIVSTDHFQVVKPSDIKAVYAQLPHIRAWMKRPPELASRNIVSTYCFLITGKLDPRHELAWSQAGALKSASPIIGVVTRCAPHTVSKVLPGDPIPAGSIGLFLPEQFSHIGVVVVACRMRIMRFCGNNVRPSALKQDVFTQAGTLLTLTPKELE